MIVTGKTNFGYVTGKGIVRVESNTLTISVEEIEFPKNWVGNFWKRESLACLSPMMMNSVFSGLNFSFTPSINELNKSEIKVPMVKC